MSIRSDPLDRLAIPDGTTAEEHDLVTEGDVVVGGQSTVDFGVRGRNVIAGERVRFGGDIEADGDCRLDMWCDVVGNVLVGADAYLGERVHVEGQLMVSGDLDIGDDVDIEEGFEANGWIVIRNPMPTIVFLFVYLSQLLRIGEEEAAEELWGDLTESDREHDPVLIPRSSKVSDDAWRVSTPATIGDDCRLNGNVRAESMTVGEETEIYGSLRAKEDIRIGEGTIVHGDVTTRGGTVTIDRTAEVRGDVSCEALELHEDAEVDGAIRARGEVSFVSDSPDGKATEEETTEGTDDGDAAEGNTDEPTYEPAIVPVDEAGEDPGNETGTDALDRDQLEPAITEISGDEQEETTSDDTDETKNDDVGDETTKEDADDETTNEDADDETTNEDADEKVEKPTVTIPDAEGDVTNGDRDQDGLAGVIAEAEER